MSNNDKQLNLPVPGRRSLGAAPTAPTPEPAAPVENTVISEAQTHLELADVMNVLRAHKATGAPAPKDFREVLSIYQAAKTTDAAPTSRNFDPDIHVVDLFDTSKYPLDVKGYAPARRAQAAQAALYQNMLTESERQGCRERGQVAFDQRVTLDPKPYWIRKEVVRLLAQMEKDGDPRRELFSHEIASANFR